MAKNTKAMSQTAQTEPYEEQTYEGIFIGSLYGNADTATALKDPFTITVAGDGTGQASTAGTSVTLSLNVNHATEAEHAKSADSVAHAATADSAAFATTAGSAVKADHATTADSATMADHATQADTASKTTHADYATRAGEADHSASADTATAAESAKTADVATVAKELQNYDKPVAEAEHAAKADLAVMAQYDCEGFSIKDFYAKKADYVSKEEAFTENAAKALFAPRSELVVQAAVTGKAYGTGRVEGQTLRINITSLAIDSGGSATIYDDVVFYDQPDLPKNPDTTKIYITSDKQMWLYDDKQQQFVNVRSAISEDMEQTLNQAIAQLTNYVDLSNEQTIQGAKTFKDEVYAPIPSFTDDPDRAVAVLHTVRDVYSKLSTDLTNMRIKLQEQITELNARMDAQQTGDMLFAYVDYSLLENQKLMVVGTTYIGLLTEEKVFIELDPETNEPVDDSLVPYYWRYFRKDSKGNVTWQDYKINSATFLEYARLDGADFKGGVTVPAQADPNSVMDQTVLGASDIRKIIEKQIENNNNKLNIDNYMPKTGGAFKGTVTVPNAVTWEGQDDQALVNKGDIEKHELKVFVQASMPDEFRKNSIYVLV